MELPRRADGDILLPPGEMLDIRRRLRAVANQHDLTSVIACAFDHRTRVLPFIYADLRMVPAGVRAIGSAMLDSGFSRTRIVLQQWNPNFKPQQMRINGQIPDLFMVSSMHIHSSQCDAMIQDVCKMDESVRPLIIAGGPRVIYSPWEVFSADPNHPWGADVAVTGEEYVLLSLLEVLLSLRAKNESMRSTFIRARDSGALDEISGLVYSRSASTNSIPEELVDTGVQRLLGNLDELPLATIGYQMLEPPSRLPTLGRNALADQHVRKFSPVSSIVMTTGCKFRCSYCPIPAYNQRQHRGKSGERIADEMGQISGRYGIINFFGTDDNFFNSTERTMEIAEALATKVGSGRRPHCKIRYGTEATVHDTIRLKEHLPVIRRSGLRAIWMGVEDITASLVRKGQSEDKTMESFKLLRSHGILPVPMMMHHDSQPLISRKGNYGLINQLRTLRKAGAVYTQVLMLTPAPGSKWFADTYTSGTAFESVNERKLDPHIVDGNYVVASKHARPWLKQLNLLAGYAYFFNPLRAAGSLIFSKTKIPFADQETRTEEDLQHMNAWMRFRRRQFLKLRAHVTDAGIQMLGILGLIQTIRRTLPWSWRLFRGKIERSTHAPMSQIPMRGVDGGPASHALPGTPSSGTAASSPGLTILDDSCDAKHAA